MRCACSLPGDSLPKNLGRPEHPVPLTYAGEPIVAHNKVGVYIYIHIYI